jgi:hypothetical protein
MTTGAFALVIIKPAQNAGKGWAAGRCKSAITCLGILARIKKGGAFLLFGLLGENGAAGIIPCSDAAPHFLMLSLLS